MGDQSSSCESFIFPVHNSSSLFCASSNSRVRVPRTTSLSPRRDHLVHLYVMFFEVVSRLFLALGQDGHQSQSSRRGVFNYEL
jgi:hypothetical protein